MGQILGNMLRLAGTGATDVLKFDSAPPDVGFLGVRLNLTVPVNNAGAGYTGLQTDLVAFLKRMLSVVVLEEGPVGQRMNVWNAADGNDLRTLHRIHYQNEIICSFFGPQTGGQIGAGASNLTATIFCPFVPPPFYKGARRLPGTTQVRQMVLRVVEGAGNPIPGQATITRNGLATIEVEFVTMPGPDQWSPVLSIQRESSPRRDATGPDGLTLIAWVPDSAASGSALTAFTINVLDGGPWIKVTDLQIVSRVWRMWQDEMVDQGATVNDINDEHTVVHFLPFGADLDLQPHGALRFEEAKSDLSPVNLRFAYLPARTPARAKAEAKTSALAAGGSVLLTQQPAGEDADPGLATTLPARVFTPSDARFTTKPGLLASAGSDVVTVSIPSRFTSAIAQQAKDAAKDGSAVARDVARRGSKVVVLAIPGTTNTKGDWVGDVADMAAKALGS